MKNFEKNLDYKFKNKKLLENALTHSSFANENKSSLSSNERLEFLGDSVLSIIVSDYIYNNFPDLPEGQLTKMRASLVCEQTLCKFSKELGMGAALKFGNGERQSGGAERPSILADAFEAVLAAIYIDGGMESAKKHVLRFIKEELKNHTSQAVKDYKTVLQEIIQKNPEEKITYVMISESGPEHQKEFEFEVRLNSNTIGKGKGRSKKQAEQMAAKQALELMGQEI